MTLHIVSCNPQPGSGFDTACQLAQKTDALLLVGNGVYSLLPNHTSHAQLLAINCPIYALMDDLNARGVPEAATGSQMIHYVDYQEWVNLAALHPQNVSWFD
ncbi:sulfurtransferase complex subunit TusB [Halioxenophilus aromaticivorans]|uniref:Sulfurtransferase complex subunit TusB n=1 Tax=Halioxenophilus aromaticivorans TaxID=1306992 RepID=A0AAV3UAN3_9ALTE